MWTRPNLIGSRWSPSILLSSTATTKKLAFSPNLIFQGGTVPFLSLKCGKKLLWWFGPWHTEGSSKQKRIGATLVRFDVEYPFLKWPLNRWRDHAEILQSKWNISHTTVGKKIDRVISGHGDVMSQEDDLWPIIFYRNCVFRNITYSHHLELRHNADLDQKRVTSDLGYCFLTLRTPSKDLGWPCTYL